MTTKKAVIARGTGSGGLNSSGLALFVGTDAACSDYAAAVIAAGPNSEPATLPTGGTMQVSVVALTDEVEPGTWVQSFDELFAPEV